MTEFRPNGLFYDVLSGEFIPPTDPQLRVHTLARLAAVACEKGEDGELDGMRVYYPSWANQSFIEVDQADGEGPYDTSLYISDAYGRWPRDLRITHTRLNRAMGPERDCTVIRGRKIDEIVRPLTLGPELQDTRRIIAEVAQDYYDGLRQNQ